jgi:hypothetical protein
VNKAAQWASCTAVDGLAPVEQQEEPESLARPETEQGDVIHPNPVVVTYTVVPLGFISAFLTDSDFVTRREFKAWHSGEHFFKQIRKKHSS